jgi:hypothetical protein
VACQAQERAFPRHADPYPRLNQAEIWFSILARKSLDGASFKAVEELKSCINAVIKDY